MVMNKLSSFLSVVILATVVVLSGCATEDVSYTNEAPVLFERIASEEVVVRDVHAYEDGEESVIYGKVKRPSDNCCDAARGHVDIAIIAPDGLVVDLISVLYSPLNIPKLRRRTSRFVARVGYIVGDDMTIRITYHDEMEFADSAEHVEGQFLCEQNMAAYEEEG